MTDNVKEEAQRVLDNYLEVEHHRKTPERYAILDAIYSFKSHFTLAELGRKMERRNFRVSRATLYNTLKMFMELRLVICHRLMNGTTYEACYRKGSHVHQICTVCGKIKEVNVPEIEEAIANAKLYRFHKDVYSLYLYGICSSCKANISRRMASEKKKLKNKQ